MESQKLYFAILINNNINDVEKMQNDCSGLNNVKSYIYINFENTRSYFWGF